ncbi:MAG: type II toxin-antitoxin system VapC family toxin [Candidatus Eremiobacteraeota bacterium]|nr:type II toxin-antitoxin system VapC family toxin [Candidatus Eremiobacteraeota bacterium]
MNEAVLDASVVLKWFLKTETHSDAAQRLRDAFQTGALSVVVPPLLHIEIINAAGRKWQWPRAALRNLAQAMDTLGFRIREAPLAAMAEWTARGLSAYDALADVHRLPLITEDRLILSTARRLARPLAALGPT